MDVICCSSVISCIYCISSALSIILGILIYQTQLGELRRQKDSLSFNHPGVCTVVYINCTSPIITLSSGTLMREVEIWEQVLSTHFCMIPSPLRLPCWWSEVERLSGFVRIGPLLPAVGPITSLSLILIAFSTFFMVVSFAYICAFTACNSWRLRWLRHGARSSRSQRRDDQNGTQMDGVPLTIEETRLAEVYPMSDPNWMEEAVAKTPYARHRIEVLERYFEARRRQLDRGEGRSEPYSSLTGSNAEFGYDDDDLPVDECYVCLSQFRRRMIWWPCGHWLCAKCVRKVVRKAVHRGSAPCPNCRGLFSQGDLLILHLNPRAVTPVEETPSGTLNEDETGNQAPQVETERETSAEI